MATTKEDVHDMPSPVSRDSLSPTLHDVDIGAATPIAAVRPEHAVRMQEDKVNEEMKEEVVNEMKMEMEMEAVEGAVGKKAAAVELQDQSNFLPTKQVILVFLGLDLALACSFLEQTMMATALPSISADLNSGSGASWIITSYLLVSTAVTPLSSRFSDIFGRKVVMLFCLAEFWIFSIACAVAQTTSQMIAFRALAGLGGGCLINLALIIASDVVSLRDRGKYQGIIEIVGAVSGGAGPLIGGGLAEYNWRWIFWLCVILCFFAIIMVWKILPLKRVEGNIKQKILQVDGLGCVLVFAASILVLLALNWGSVIYPWVSGPVLGTLIAGIFMFAVFGVYEAFGPRIPIVPMSIFKYRTVNGVLIMTICIGALQYCLLFYIPQWFQVVRGISSLKSGVLLLPYLTVIGPTVFINANIVSKTGQYRPQIYLGSMLWAVAMGLLTTVDQNTPQSRVLGFESMAGIGAGCVFQTTLSALQAAVQRHEISVATGFRNFCRLLSGTIFLALGSSIINQSITNIGLSESLLQQILNDPPSIHTLSGIDDETRQRVIDAYQGGFRTVFYVLVGFSALSAVSAFTLIKHHSLRREDDAELKAAGHKFMQERKDRKLQKKSIPLETPEDNV